MSRRLLLLGALLAGATACGSETAGPFTPAPDAGPADTGVEVRDAARDVVRDTGRDVPRNTNPLVVGVVPAHGPFTGGNRVVVRGSNFDEGAEVRFNGALVQPQDTVLVDSHRINVLPPANRPGDVDVEVVLNGQRALLPRGYHYDAFYLEPGEGTVSGGTLVTIRGLGTHFSDVTTVTFDDAPCTSVRAVGPEQLTCITPAHPEGRARVAVATGDERITVEDGYNFNDSADTLRGGLGGGEIAGTINVTVLNSTSGDGIPGAHVYLGTDPTVAAPRATRTDMRGRATIAVPDLRGPVTLTAAARCFSSHTVQAFDARNVTVYLYPQMIPSCGMGEPPGGGGRGRFGTTVSGELVWPGPNEFAPNPWRNVPEPRAGERRVAFVYASQQDILYSERAPGDGGTVLEVVTPGYGGRGYPFSIVARPASLAVYAIAGIEDVRTQRFTPYIMGVARGVLGSPGAMVTNVAVDMDIPLDHETRVILHNVPRPVRGEPDRIKVEAFIDLGGEGVIPRPDVAVWGRDETDPYNLVALPAFAGTIADARLIVRAIYGSGQYLVPPYTVVVQGAITTPDEVVHIREWVGMPNITAPTTDNGQIPEDRLVRFDLAGGGINPDMFWVTLSGDHLYWQTWTPGTERSFQYPDHSRVSMLSDLPPGQTLYMNIAGLRVPAFNFNQFRYSYLSQLYWTAYSSRTVLISR